MMLQIDNIKSNHEKCRDRKLTGVSSAFDTIAYRVSHQAIKFMHKETNISVLKKGVPLTSIHDFWKKLDTEMTSDVDNIDYDEDTYKRLWDDFLSAPLPIRKRLFQNLREVLYPSSADLKEPDIIKSKGHPKKKSNSRHPSEWEYTENRYGLDDSNAPVKKSKRQSSLRSVYIASIQSKPPQLPLKDGIPNNGVTPNDSSKSPATNCGSGQWKSICTSPYNIGVPPFIIPFIRDFFYVKSDWNCGYRVVAFHLWGDEDRWLEVRKECYRELNHRKDLYNRIFGNLSSVDDILNKIEWEGTNAPIDKWMTLPELGHIIATTYNIIFVSYGIHGGYTFLSIIIDDDIESPKRTLVIGFIHQVRHFIALRMCDENDYPLPGVAWY
ncbi:hypothetical protein LIER_00247 [Lithospermum erythrorhizon]|uniref:OTU domain-containing protein n=1 Tax=Lithospermum erythrorhizon TaxID=34254 RepID=A0AAV3NJ48_LITER